MPLEDAALAYTGKKIFVWPVGAFGWSELHFPDSTRQAGTSISRPSPFGATLTELISFENKVIAGIGAVDEPSHPLNKCSVAFCLRDRGSDPYNFTDNPGKYNVRMGNSAPAIHVDYNIPMPHWMRFTSFPVYSGICYIATSQEWLVKKYPWLINA